ncbi:hypothetical protein [Parafrankia sp. FMc2]|uniref:hypothetical protein n=1 Tax=Parafrankia sp. FMc2 TaxID=3233196 RepID=UPI0034D47EA9
MSRKFALSAASRPQTLAALVSAMGLLVALAAMFTNRGPHAGTSVLGVLVLVAMLALITGMGVLIGQAVSRGGGGRS